MLTLDINGFGFNLSSPLTENLVQIINTHTHSHLDFFLFYTNTRTKQSVQEYIQSLPANKTSHPAVWSFHQKLEGLSKRILIP